MPLTISKHAKERYAERIMDRDSKTDVLMFIRDHENKIQQDIEKMVEYGTLLYEGPTSKDPRRNTAVTLNGNWVVIWDAKEMTVITLYCIDLGVGDEANKVFISSALQRINEAKAEYEREIAQNAAYKATYEDIIAKNEENLAIYRKRVKDIESQIAGCRDMIKGCVAQDEIAGDKYREAVEILIGRQKF